jgi:hypothetical protein
MASSSTLDSPQPILGGILDLIYRQLVGSLQQQGTSLSIGAVFHKRVLFFSIANLFYRPCVSQVSSVQDFHRQNGLATTGQCQALHIAALGTT